MKRFEPKTINMGWKNKIFSLFLIVSIFTLFLSISFATGQTTERIKAVSLITTNGNQENITHCKTKETVVLEAIITDPKDAENPRYKYYYKSGKETKWNTIDDWSSDSKSYWAPEGEGLYSLKVEAKSQDSENVQASKTINSFVVSDIQSDDKVKEVKLSISPASPALNSTKITLKASASGDSVVEYRFSKKSIDNSMIEGKWTVIRNWDSDAVLSWASSDCKGKILFMVEARTINSEPEACHRAVVGYMFKGKLVSGEIQNISLNLTGKTLKGNNLTLKAQAKYKSGQSGTPLYKYWFKKNGSGWEVIEGWTASNTITWMPADIGSYELYVEAKTKEQAQMGIETEAFVYTDKLSITQPEEVPISKGKILFTDVSIKHWAYKEVSSMAKEGVVQGVANNKFEPDSYVTREQFAKIMVNSLKIGLPENGAIPSYTDVVSDSNANWAWDYIVKADKYLGQGGTLFKPKDSATRFEIAKALVKFSEEKYGPIDISSFDSGIYTEFIQNKLNEEQKTVVAKAISGGIMKGYTNKDGTYSFKLNDKVTRAETAVVLYRMSQK